MTLLVHIRHFCSSFAKEARSLREMRGRVEMKHHYSPRELSTTCNNLIQIMSSRTVAITPCHRQSPQENRISSTKKDTKMMTKILKN